MNYLDIPNKQIRAKVIKKFLQGKNYRGVVCFSCGNATKALKAEGLNVIDISPEGDFIPNKWFQPSEVREMFPDYFDATSGHLSMELMQEIALAFRSYLGDNIPEENNVASGSGETIVCLKLAYPDRKFNAVYNLDKATEWSPYATLNALVEATAQKVIIFKGGTNGTQSNK